MSPHRADIPVAELWGFLEADPLIIGVVLAAVIVCAIVYMVRRAKRKAGGS